MSYLILRGDTFFNKCDIHRSEIIGFCDMLYLFFLGVGHNKVVTRGTMGCWFELAWWTHCSIFHFSQCFTNMINAVK